MARGRNSELWSRRGKSEHSSLKISKTVEPHAAFNKRAFDMTGVPEFRVVAPSALSRFFISETTMEGDKR
jgi:hypothetical protein